MSMDISDATSHEFMMATLVDTVEGILTEHRLGVIDRASLSPQYGRNLSCTVTTTDNKNLFVKRVNGDDQFKASVTADKFLSRVSGSADPVLFRKPRLIVASDIDNILIFDGVSNADSMAAALRDGILDKEQLLRLMSRIGAGLRELHEQPINPDNINVEPSCLPMLGHFRQLPWASFESFSAASLQAWGTLQQDAELYHAVTSLREMESTGTQVPIHGDLRFDQFLIDDDQALWLIDWEEFRLGHPGRDLGGLIGEWLHTAFSMLISKPSPPSVVRNSPPQGILDQEFTHDEIVGYGQEALNTVLPKISVLWRSYLGQDTPVQGIAELAAVTAAFAGWHLYDRLLATSELTSRISALSWAAAGIGRNILLNPTAAAKILGLTVNYEPDSLLAIRPNVDRSSKEKRTNNCDTRNYAYPGQKK